MVSLGQQYVQSSQLARSPTTFTLEIWTTAIAAANHLSRQQPSMHVTHAVTHVTVCSRSHFPPTRCVWCTADSWVGRDLIGRRFTMEAPFLTTGAGPKRVRAGLPTPVQCCWNGMARIDAAPFLAGLRFRTHLEGECMASECSLVCDDLWRMGPEALGGHSARILMDPSGELGAFAARCKVSVHLQHATHGHNARLMIELPMPLQHHQVQQQASE